MNYKALSEPFPSKFVDTVRKGNRSESYVNHAVVTDRLNRVHPDHTIELLHVERYDDEKGLPHCAGVWVRLTIQGVYRDEVGTVGRPSNYGDEIKACMSDALKRAAMRFGVAIQLWHELPASTAGKDRPAPGEGATSAVPSQPSASSTAAQVEMGAAAGTPERAQVAIGEGSPCAHREAVKSYPNGRIVPQGKAYCPDCNKVVAA